MAYLLLSILSIIIFSPLVMPWGKKLFIYCITAWFLLWLMFFIQMNRETNPTYDAGIVSDGVALGFSILVFVIVIALRSLAQFIWYKINEKRNYT